MPPIPLKAQRNHTAKEPSHGPEYGLHIIIIVHESDIAWAALVI
jgi:hypothetical protein